MDLKRFIGSSRGPDANYTRLVDRITVHGGYLRGSEILDQVITDKTKYLVMDLDRTFHFGRNLGELLGWELSAGSCYGEDYMARIDSQRIQSRFLFAKDQPLAMLKYILRGARLWTFPGLFYLFCGKLAGRRTWSNRLRYRLFGAHPVAVVQEVPRLALMHHMTEFSLDALRNMSRRLWNRYSGDQVFFREDFEALRKKYPQLKIIISSASPQPIVETARDDLGIEDIIYTTIEEHDGFLSSPHFIYRYFLLYRKPKRISPPDSFKQNSSYMKIKHLLELYPDMLDSEVETVGITDTGYGEDHAWAHYFTRVVDINSSDPFSPIVSNDSPLKEIHSAKLLTADEIKQRESGNASYLNPKRKEAAPTSLALNSSQLTDRLQPVVQSLETLADSFQRAKGKSQAVRQELEREISDVQCRIDEVVRNYNQSQGAARDKAFKQLRSYLKQLGRLGKRLTKTQREQAAIMYSIEWNLTLSRKLIERSD
ncbi:MAG: hypothetical protein P9M14_18435 [Candidatus Alcyoniella australis]|nr:hypothetical protein [Candidatus Alcyoniella australis]